MMLFFMYYGLSIAQSVDLPVDTILDATPDDALPGMMTQVALGFTIFGGEPTDSLRRKVFDWTWDEGNKWNWNGNHFIYPDQVTIQTINECEFTNIETTSVATSYSSTLSSTADSYSAGFDTGDINVGVEYDDVAISGTIRNSCMFGYSSSNTDYQRQASSKRTKSSISRVNARSYKASIWKSMDLIPALNTHFEEAVRQFAADPSKENAAAFVADYGTHYCSEVVLGAYAQRTAYYESNMDASAISKSTSETDSEGASYFFIKASRSHSSTEKTVNSKGESSTVYTSGTILKGGNPSSTSAGDFCASISNKTEIYTPIIVEIGELLPLDTLFDSIQGVPSGTGAKMHEFIRQTLQEGVECARKYVQYDLAHPWTEGLSSNCLNLGCETLSGLAECKARCTNNAECNVLAFCPEGADCTSGTNRCCLRKCSGSDDQQLVNWWGGWDVWTKSEPGIQNQALSLCKISPETMQWTPVDPAKEPPRCISQEDSQAPQDEMPSEISVIVDSSGRRAEFPGWALRTGDNSWELPIKSADSYVCTQYENGDLLGDDAAAKAVTLRFRTPDVPTHAPTTPPASSERSCPVSHPYAYRPSYNFDYCCASAGDCHGNPLINAGSRTSRSDCCTGDAYVKCSNPPCVDYVASPTYTQYYGCDTPGCAVEFTLTEARTLWLWPTDYSDSDEYVDIYINGEKKTWCSPDADGDDGESHDWYACGYFSAGRVRVQASSAVNCCAKNSHYVYVKIDYAEEGTCGGNAGGAPCQFPFSYNVGSIPVYFSACTSYDHNQPWCYTTNHGKWGNCNCPSGSSTKRPIHPADYRCSLAVGQSFRGPPNDEDVEFQAGVSDVHQCSAFCSANPSCEYFVFETSGSRKGGCWLKQNYDRSESAGTMISGFRCAEVKSNLRYVLPNGDAGYADLETVQGPGKGHWLQYKLPVTVSNPGSISVYRNWRNNTLGDVTAQWEVKIAPAGSDALRSNRSATALVNLNGPSPGLVNLNGPSPGLVNLNGPSPGHPLTPAEPSLYTKRLDVSCRKIKVEKHGVKRAYKTHSFLKAKTKCEELGEDCAGVLDSGCDARGKYNLCKKSDKPLKTKPGYCIYIKENL